MHYAQISKIVDYVVLHHNVVINFIYYNINISIKTY
jgi:hypothetical protein